MDPDPLPEDRDYSDAWTDGSIVEIQIECGRCGRDMGCFSAYLSLVGEGNAWEIDIGRDWSIHGELHGAARSVPSGQHDNEYPYANRNRWTLICPGRRCGYRRVVGFERVGRAMVKTWRVGSHRMVVGVDF